MDLLCICVCVYVCYIKHTKIYYIASIELGTQGNSQGTYNRVHMEANQFNQGSGPSWFDGLKRP